MDGTGTARLGEAVCLIINFMKTTLRLNAKIFPIIGMFALIMQLIDASRVWVILMVGLGGTWLICYWWMRGLGRSLQIEREIRYGWTQVGDRLEERFTLSNHFLLPATWVHVQDNSDLPDHHASIATGVDGASVSQWKIQSQCTRRGLYTLGGTTLYTGDPLGIYTLTLEDPTSSSLAVMPPVVPLPNFPIFTSGWSGNGRRNPQSLEETLDASHTREMVPNDPMKWIHWKSTAKQNKFFVRQFEGTPAGDWWILLDLCAQVQIGEGWDSTEEHGVVLAASLTARALQGEHPVGMAVNSQKPAWIAPRRNENQQRTLLKALAVASPSELSFKHFLQRIGSSLHGRSSALVLTADPDPTWTEALMPMIWRGVTVTVFLLDPVSFGGRAKMDAVMAALQSMGLPYHVIPKELLDGGQIHPGTEGEWEWRVSGTGKAIARKTPVADWRRLG